MIFKTHHPGSAATANPFFVATTTTRSLVVVVVSLLLLSFHLSCVYCYTTFSTKSKQSSTTTTRRFISIPDVPLSPSSQHSDDTSSSSSSSSSSFRNNNQSQMKVSLKSESGSDNNSLVISRRPFLKTGGKVLAVSLGVSSWFGLSFPTTKEQSVVHAMTNDPTTGIALPDVGEIEQAIPTDWSNVENPFVMLSDDNNNNNNKGVVSSSSKSMFGRLDSKPDSIFYQEPRFVEHVDDNAVQTMTEYISNEALQKNTAAVLDLCSSWTSHITKDRAKELTRVAGLGMNAKELESNDVLTEWIVQDLNMNPVLPYEDESFDVVLCQLSIDYLTKPLEVLRQVSRVLKPGGRVHIIFSNRLFLSKAVGLWTGADDIDHAYYVGCYLHFCNGGFFDVAARDLSKRKGREKRIVGDPLYVVRAAKSS